MTNYKRFISYLYSYELGTRKENVGFARVETSNEVCKLTLHCNMNQSVPRDAKVFIFRGKKDDIEAVETEHINASDSTIDVKLSFDKGKIAGGNFLFQDCQGVVIMAGRENYIAARWDDSPVSYEEVRNINRLQSRIEVSKESAVPKTIQTIPETLRTEYVDADAIQVIETRPAKEQKEEIAAKEQKEEMAAKEEHEETMVSDSEVLTVNIKEEDSVEAAMEHTAEEVKAAGLTESKEEEKEVDVSIASFSQAAQEGLWIDHPSARLILNKFVRMYPFDDGEIAECVRLEPKDIGLLPMNTWVLGNNSFLLHSYCNFRHILFGKKLTRTGCEYLLMVPGVMNKHEEQLAKMFGFQNFKCSRRRYARSGEFGYWYIPINFNS